MRKNDDSKFFDASRLKDLGDCIFAFSMTFLIVTMDFPKTSSNLLQNELNRMAPYILTYVLSFFLLAIFWMTNHIQMKNVKRADSRLVWINMLLFLLIVFIPLTSDLYAFYDAARITMLTFNLNICLIGLAFMLQWHHLVANSMHHEEFTKKEIKDRYQICQVLILTSLSAIILGLFYPVWSPIVYLAMFINSLYIRLKATKEEIPANQ
jgi:uncharacterized membrane protein